MNELISEFLSTLENHHTKSSYSTILQQYDSFTKEISLPLVSDFLKQYSNLSPKTIAYKISILRKFFTFLQKKGMLTRNPIDDITIPSYKQRTGRYLEEEQIQKILQYEFPDTSIGLRNKAILYILWYCGSKISETLDLYVKDYLKDTHQLHFSGTHERNISIPEKCESCLQDYLIKTDLINQANSFLFPSNNKSKHLTREYIVSVLKKIDSNLSPEVLRNSFAVYQLKSGMNIRELKEQMGKESFCTTFSTIS